MTGRTDLVDGARLDFTAVNEAFNQVQFSAIVTGGAYEVAMDASHWGTGEFVLWVEFWPGHSQSQTVRDKYGDDGSKMYGGMVRTDPDLPGLEWFGAWTFNLN